MNRKLATRVISLLPLRIEPRFVFAALVSSLAACGGAPADDVEAAPVDADVTEVADALDDALFDVDDAVLDEDDVDIDEDSEVDEDVDEDSDVDEDVAAGEDVDEDVFTDASVERSAAGSSHERSRLNIATVNIGRGEKGHPYKRHEMVKAINEVKSTLEKKSGPLLIGWQEIGERDPCGQCEFKEVRSTFDGDRFQTFRPHGLRPNGDQQRVLVPITLRDAGDDVKVRARFASAPWKKVSPTRFVTVTYSPELNVAHLNTHLIAGAWSCWPQVERRKDFWRQGWRALKDAVANQVAHGHNVVVTGDINRPRSKNHCNPQWDPSTLHPRARVVGGSGIDYIFAVPAAGQRFVYERKNGDVLRGNIHLGIDSHKGWWVAGHFRPKN